MLKKWQSLSAKHQWQKVYFKKSKIAHIVYISLLSGQVAIVKTSLAECQMQLATLQSESCDLH